MKRLLPLLFLFVSLSAFTGCGSSPEATYANVQDVYIATVDTIIELKEAGKISQDDYDTIVLPTINAGDEILDKYLIAVKTAKATGEPISRVILENLTADLRSVLNRLKPFLLGSNPPLNIDRLQTYDAR